MDEQFSYEGLYRLLEERRAKRPEGSYTTYLFEKGLDKILKKVGEECTEVIIAAKDRDHKETVYELADLAYHVLVLMVEAGISLDEVRAELAGRHVIDHKVKQEKMPPTRRSEENLHTERRSPWSRKAAPGAPVHLYRPNCQKATALAAATLRESTPRAMGMQTV